METFTPTPENRSTAASAVAARYNVSSRLARRVTFNPRNEWRPVLGPSARFPQHKEFGFLLSICAEDAVQYKLPREILLRPSATCWEVVGEAPVSIVTMASTLAAGLVNAIETIKGALRNGD